jgi:hypothetical protein
MSHEAAQISTAPAISRTGVRHASTNVLANYI